ncbi:MAG: GNAT family N-acetyltransferase [Xenococcaceae cyanobacterium MO_188.B32]|nr:GNAT family N-acetyltransferase [Xenococcaceae cyanobacterium MO_188.B32]
MIRYIYSADNIKPEQLKGFCVNGQHPLSQKTHLKLLLNSDEIVLAIDDETDKVVGFITAVTDKIISAYIPLLEVLPDYQNKGIGNELMRIMLTRLQQFYMVDLLCDSKLQSFYEKLGMQKVTGMCIRNHEAIRKII